MINQQMVLAKSILSVYMEGNLKAEVFIDENKNFGARFYKDNVWITDEVYVGHNCFYAEDAAENYVLGVKHLHIRS